MCVRNRARQASILDDALAKIQLASILVEMGVSTPAAAAGPKSNPEACASPAVVEEEPPSRAGYASETDCHADWARGTPSPDDDGRAAGDAAVVSRSPALPSGGSEVGGSCKADLVTPRGARAELSRAELDRLRRERNRLHAKMTRDRKKEHIHSLETRIEVLEAGNQSRRQKLSEALMENLPSGLMDGVAARLGISVAPPPPTHAWRS
jgi:hypothetical protein